MKRPVFQAVAIAIGFATALGAFSLLKSVDMRSSPAARTPVIGEIIEVSGRVERRPPGGTTSETIPGPRPFRHQELIITQRGASAILKFDSAGTVLRLEEATRFVSELDTSREGAMIGTILDGTARVINPGNRTLFRLYKDGRELSLDEAPKADVPVIPAQAPAATPSTSGVLDSNQTLLITATKPIETPTPAPRATAPESEPSSEILTNEDIVKGLRAQTGFFQRCYLGHIHREQPKPGPGGLAGTGGTIVVGFLIQTNGRVSEAKIVRSDFKDTTLHACISEVLERTLFRGFKGKPVPVREFPISLK